VERDLRYIPIGVRYLATSLLALAVSSGASSAAALEIGVRCDRLRESEVEELAARARLILKANQIEPSSRSVLVGCTPTTSWVEWAGPTRARRIDIDEQQGIVEGALDALESLLRSVPPQPEPARETAPPEEPAAPGAGTPSPRDPTSPGGLGLGASGEPIGSGDLAIGPRLDVGFGTGAFAGFATEGVRFTTGASGAVLIDTQLGASWGAPFAPRHPFGAAVSLGFEWLTAALAGGGASSGLTDTSLVVSAGPRARERRALGRARLQAACGSAGARLADRRLPSARLGPAHRRSAVFGRGQRGSQGLF
jgi:hypothetical protein